ncbi:zinc finger, GRF-type containing protein [Tanacetum coccineum]
MVICACGKITEIKTLLTDRNTSRKFFYFPTLGTNCGFIGWVDSQMWHKALDVIHDLLRARNDLEEDLEELCLMLREKENLVKKLWKNPLIAWLLAFVVYKFL